MISALISMIERAARDPNVDIEKMERLFAVHERMQATASRMAYDAAFATMQPELPEIDRRGKIIPWLGLTVSVLAQYNSAESVEHDPVGERYFVSNLRDGTIKQRDQAGVVTPFASVSPDPYGLEILGDTLYACSGGRVKGFLLPDGSQVFDLNTGGGFLNGIDRRALPVRHRFQRAEGLPFGTLHGDLHHLGGEHGRHTERHRVRTGERRAAGGLLGAGCHRAWLRPFHRFHHGFGQYRVGSIDGITIECHGLVVISSWSPNRISRFEWGIISPLFDDLMVPNLNQPADIDFDTVHDRICIPSGGNDQVILFDLADCATAVPGAPVSESGKC